MNNFHSTAIVSSKATIGDNVTIGPFAFIEDDVEIGNDCRIGPHAAVYNGARIGDRVKIMQGAAVSNIPQDLKFDNEESCFYLGDDSIIREFVTLHRGTVDTGYSKVGKNCLLMAYAHVAHDVIIGDNCIIANGVQVAGHVTIEDYVIIGGCTPVHQFCKVGQHSMTGGAFRIVKDVPPYVVAGNEPLKFHGLNVIGLRRRGFSNDDIMTLKKVYTLIYDSGMNVSQAIEKIKIEMGEHKLVQNVINFIENSDRGIIGR
ncbi:acyl-[acyl-carrier-protein]--UDP-N-acetylglucosamine O-acyltransferase [bacterium BMS3Abin03]|nr:acyl-[acyl-carrier-protein]--UDP-N-acetylglucosamine O-acyltransferase [bacterium BMS3Abin03]HDZ58929.1 acyl-ACP--UDP-N-acetylglucosamine O-acyltransferase [Ignavibacteriales bacterium]